MSRVRIGGAGGRRNVRLSRMQQRTCSSVFRCALNVVTVVELLVDEDREFQTAELVQRY